MNEYYKDELPENTVMVMHFTECFLISNDCLTAIFHSY